MRVETEIKKWGNSLALRITGVMAELPMLKDGSKVTIEVTEDGFTVKKATIPKRKINFPYSENSLLQGMTSYKAHADEVAIPTIHEIDA